MAPALPVIPGMLALLLGAQGIKKRSLSPSGGITAFVVGFLMISVPLRGFGVSLIVFYLIGSKVTKVGKHLKGKLEEGHDMNGYRSGWQVLCNSFTAFIASCLWGVLFAPASIHAHFIGPFIPSFITGNRADLNMAKVCPMNPDIGGGWSRALILMGMAHFACCLGDTMASELGILSKTPPRLITTFAVVPPGTNGAMSRTGTLASLAGGVIMGVTMLISLLIESPACRGEFGSLTFSLVLAGACGGLGGSGLDSLLGATIQRTEFSGASNSIITDETKSRPRGVGEVKVIAGVDILTNNQRIYQTPAVQSWIGNLLDFIPDNAASHRVLAVAMSKRGLNHAGPLVREAMLLHLHVVLAFQLGTAFSWPVSYKSTKEYNDRICVPFSSGVSRRMVSSVPRWISESNVLPKRNAANLVDPLGNEISDGDITNEDMGDILDDKYGLLVVFLGVAAIILVLLVALVLLLAHREQRKEAKYNELSGSDDSI